MGTSLSFYMKKRAEANPLFGSHVMKPNLFIGIFVCYLTSVAYCDISIQYDINTETGQSPISPYIYGFNFTHVTSDNLTVRRIGGNRLTM